ncbi:MAG TPA: DUF4239 domain-containing protein [Rubrobacter sp.]|nr:DUF4239 domain-containing protein [Rubrobacter sp.]
MRKGGGCVATVVWGVVVVTLSVARALAGMILVGRLVPFSVRESHNANTATMFGALYVMYGLMVGFSAYLVAGQYDAAQKTVENEAGSVEEIYRLAEQLPGQERREIQGLAGSYARTVVDEAWPMMERGRRSAQAAEIGDELRRSVMAFEPRTGAEQAVYGQALTLVQDFDEYRALRLLEVREGIPSILWVVLILGGVITICFTYLFGMRTPRLHVVMVVALTVVLALVLYTIRALEYPFDGIVQVKPVAFEAFLDKIKAGDGR